MQLSQKQKRRLRQVLQTLGVENLLRSVYRFIVSQRLQLRYGNQTIVELNIHSKKVKFSTEDLYSKRQFLVMQDQSYEEPITRLIAERMQQARIFVDVGANLGYYTCIASHLMPEGQVYAFEIDDDNLALLNRNVQLNQSQNVQVLRKAVTNEVGTVQYIKDTDKGSVGFGLSTRPEHDRQYGQLISVEAITLDDFFADGIVPDLYKIDVEGAEFRVLQGMSRLLAAPKVEIFVEVHPDRILNFDATVRDVINLLLDHEFSIYEIPKFSGRSESLSPVSRETIITENHLLYAVKS